jgi:25S rRNA (cytosine2278-C5)-methyltransferase
MNFYFDAAKIIDRLDAKHGSVKNLLSTLPEKSRKRTAALVIETLKCKWRTYSALTDDHTFSPDKPALTETIAAANLLNQEKKITSHSLALVLVHDLLLAGGIQAGDGPVKQALLRHKTRLRGEWQRLKIKRGVKTDGEMALADDVRAGRLWSWAIDHQFYFPVLSWTTETDCDFFFLAKR